MKKIFWIVLLVLATNQLLAQDYILKTKNKVERKLDHLYTKTERPFSKKDLAHVLVYTINDSLSLPFSLMLYFDKTNRCIAEEKIFSCDTCMRKHLAYILSGSYPKWHAAEDGNYRSNFPSSSYMQTLVSNNLFILRITYLGWKGGRYENFVDGFNK
jgi:hypothetical protein